MATYNLWHFLNLRGNLSEHLAVNHGEKMLYEINPRAWSVKDNFKRIFLQCWLINLIGC